jgi:hypothetical protein
MNQDQIFKDINLIIDNNQEKIRSIYGFVKTFDSTRINDEKIEEKKQEIIAHFKKSTDPRSVHGRTLGDEQTNLSAIILAGFDLNLYSCEYVDIATGKCIQEYVDVPSSECIEEYIDIATGKCIREYESDLINKKANDYFNMILQWYKMKVGGFSNEDIIDNLDGLYEQKCGSKPLDSNNPCVISG